MVLAGPFRRVTKIGCALAAVFLLLAFASGSARVLDTILLWFAGGDLPGPVGSYIGTWEPPTFGLLAGVMLLVFSLVCATASTEPIYEEIQGGILFHEFRGKSRGARTVSKILTTVACFIAALYGFAIFSDAILDTNFESWFRTILQSDIPQTWKFHLEWAASIIFVGLFILFCIGLILYFIRMKHWVCLAAMALGLTVSFAWAISAGPFEDWGGPLRDEWEAIIGWLHKSHLPVRSGWTTVGWASIASAGQPGETEVLP